MKRTGMMTNEAEHKMVLQTKQRDPKKFVRNIFGGSADLQMLQYGFFAEVDGPDSDEPALCLDAAKVRGVSCAVWTMVAISSAVHCFTLSARNLVALPQFWSENASAKWLSLPECWFSFTGVFWMLFLPSIAWMVAYVMYPSDAMRRACLS